MASFVTWAWPRGHVLQRVDWRERLHAALQRRLQREPTLADVAYHTDAEDGGAHRTRVEVTIDNHRYGFSGVPQDTICASIRCVAWLALMELCTAGILEPPPEIGG